MAPTKKSKSVNKRIDKANEESDAKKTVSTKRKLANMLGPQWSKGELQMFYEAYRKHGKDWEMVVGVLPNRTLEMVEALFNMNKSYLSLPEGSATAAGLIAMMADLCNVLEDNGNGNESEDVPRTSCKRQKRSNAHTTLVKKIDPGDSYPDVKPRAVGKRTPRIFIANAYRKSEGNVLLLTKTRSTCEVSNAGYQLLSLSEAARNRSNDVGYDDNDEYYGNAVEIEHECTMDLSDGKTPPSSDSSMKRRDQQLSEDEKIALEALLALADSISRNLLVSSTIESDSSIQAIEETKKFDNDEKSNVPKPMLMDDQSNTRLIEQRSDKIANDIGQDADACSDKNQQIDLFMDNILERKKTEKIENPMLDSATQTTETETLEASTEKGRSHLKKVRRKNITKPQKYLPSDTFLQASTSSDIYVQATTSNNSNLAKRKASKRKIDLENVSAGKGLRNNNKNGDDHPDNYSLNEVISRCLSFQLLRRWCLFEFFYSAIDYPWFALSEFKECLSQAIKDPAVKLTRYERGLFRSSLGYTRRFSDKFLQEERKKLEKYRESVRMYYAEQQLGNRKGFPKDLPLPLSVGQRVITYHPKTKEIRDGYIQIVDYNRYMVLYDRPELGAVFVKDIDCMPADGNSHNYLMDNSMTQEKENKINSGVHSQLWQQAQRHSREADVRVVAELERALDKKEIILKEFMHMNEEVCMPQKENISTIDSMNFGKQYAQVVVQLHESNKSVKSALDNMRACNTYYNYVSKVWEVVQNSKQRAKTMVDVAVQAAEVSKPKITAYETEMQLPLKLISNCVATLLMIRNCAERGFHQDEIAQVLSYAFKGLQPCGPKNMPIYADIEKYMSIIKYQLLEKVPT